LATLQGLEVVHAEIGELAIVWAAGCQGGASSCHATDSEFGLLLGYAVDDGRWLDAKRVLDRWTCPSTRNDVFDGYFLGVAYSKTQGLGLCVDCLGLFPLYYSTRGNALVASSSAELFSACHWFESGLDLRGLTGIFLANGLIGNRCLLAGTKRVDVGSQLRWTPTHGTCEVEVYRIRPHESYRLLSGNEVREQVDAELRRAIHRHCPQRSSTVLMLSGGLDSRLMAGYLRSEGVTESALALGRPEDYEIRAATQVTAALQMRLHTESTEPTAHEFLDSARRVARWEHLEGGFGALEMLAAGDVVGQLAPFFWSGFVMDEVLGGLAPQVGRDPDTATWSFERFLRRINSWGLAPSVLTELLRSSESELLIREQLEVFRREYEREGQSPWQNSFQAKLASRTRFHIGTILHRMSFRSWPLLPMLDRRLLDLFFNVNVELLLQRRLQRALLATHYPRLAKIPFDTNSFCFEPSHVKGARDHRLTHRLAVSFRRRVRQWYWQHWRGVEPRRYFRYFDLNSPLWRAVREETEPYRDMLDRWLDRRVFDELLPPPSARLEMRNPFSEGAARRSLLGLMLWSASRCTVQKQAA